MLLLILILLLLHGTPSIAISCGSNTRYTDDITPIIDYDVNCGVSSPFWGPRFARDRDYSLEIYTNTLLLANDGPGRPVFNNMRRHVFPININPSQTPIATVEMFVRLSNIVPNSFLFSSESTMYYNRDVPGRALMASDTLNTNCSQHLHPIGPSSTPPCTLSSQDLNMFVHLVTTFDHVNQLVTIWINSEFSQSFNMSTYDNEDSIRVNGRVGDTTISDLSTMSFVYLRVWDRYLSPTQMRAVNDEWFRTYNQPIITNSVLEFTALNGTVLTATAESRPVMFWEAHRYTNTTQLVASGYGNSISLVVSGSIDYSTTFRACRYPNMQYTLAPFFASPTSCDIATTTNATFSSGIGFLTVTSILSSVSAIDEKYVCGDQDVRRMSYYVTFNRPVKQALNMPLLQQIGHGQGYEFVDTFYGTSFSNVSTDAWTLLSEDRMSFRWDVNARCGHTTSSHASLPDTLRWPLTDDYNIPLARSQNFLRQLSDWQYYQQTFIIGIKADIVPDTIHRTSDGAYEVAFNLTWNYQVNNFDPIQDVILCNGCTLVRAVQLSTGRRYNYRIRTPVLDDDEEFKATLAINPKSLAYDRSYTWSTLAQSINLYQPMVGTFIINHDGDDGNETHQDETIAAGRYEGDNSLSAGSIAGIVIGAIVGLLLFVALVAYVVSSHSHHNGHPTQPLKHQLKPTIADDVEVTTVNRSSPEDNMNDRSV